MLVAMSATRFDDVGPIPKVIVQTPSGPQEISYARHHVIPTDVFEKSEFLQILAKEGLWNQFSFRDNGVALVESINGEHPSKADLRGLIAGAAHTGGHVNYSAAQTQILDRFYDAYQSNTISDKWGASNYESGWLAAQASKIHGYVSVLKIELVNPDSGLKLHSGDRARLDVSSRELWSKIPELFDPKSLDFNKAIYEHPGFVEGSKHGAGAFNASPGSGSPLDVTSYTTADEVTVALRDQYGVDQKQPSLFDKAQIYDSVGMLKHHNALIVGMAAAGLVTLVLKHQEALSSELQREVTFDEARQSLGIEVDGNQLRQIAAGAILDIGVSAALPAAWAKQAWELLLSGEDAIGLIRLYGQVFPGSDVMQNLNRVADTIESSSGYQAYKEHKDYLKDWISKQFELGGDGLPQYKAELPGTFHKPGIPFGTDYPTDEVLPYTPPPMTSYPSDSGPTPGNGYDGLAYHQDPSSGVIFYFDPSQGWLPSPGLNPDLGGPSLQIGVGAGGEPIYQDPIGIVDGIWQIPPVRVRPNHEMSSDFESIPEHFVN